MQQTPDSAGVPTSLDTVLTTEQLRRRPQRQPDYQRENQALTSLAQALADEPGQILQHLTEVAMRACDAGSAGISLLREDDGDKSFYWPAIAGAWTEHVGGGMPYDASPCGVVVDSQAVQLFTLPERHYQYMVAIKHPIKEALLAPFFVNGEAVGTVWLIAHDEQREFDQEDARLLTSLSRFAAAAHQTHAAIRKAEVRQDAITRSESHLRRSLETLTNLIQKSPFGVCIIDSQFRLEHVNEGARKVLRKAHPLIGRDYDEVLRMVWPEPYAREISDRFRHTLETGEPYRAPELLRDRESSPDVESYDWRLERITLPDGQYGVVCYFYDLSDVRRAHRELRNRNEQFQTLLNQAPMGMYLVDADFRLAQVNPAAMPVFEMADVIGRDFGEVLHSMWPVSRAESLVQVFRHTLDTGEPVHFPEFAEHRSDREVTEYYDWRTERIVLPDGRYGVVCYFRDISEQVEARQAIAKSEERLRVATAAAKLGLHDFNVPTGTVQWDERTRELWGVGPDEPITYELWRESLHPDDRDRAEHAVQSAFDPAGEGYYYAQYRVTCRIDGITRWIEATGSTTFVDGQPVRLVGTVKDITDRKEAEEALARMTAEADRQRRLYDTIISSTPDLVYVFDLNYRFTFVNQALLEMWGRTLEDSVGKNLLEIGYEPWHAEMHEREIDQVIATKKPVRGEVPFPHAKLGTRIYDYIFVPVLNEHGEVESIAGTTRDITDRKQAEEALQEADRRKDEFLATLAHELRNPMAAIRMALGVLDRSGNDPAQVQQMKGIIERQSAQLVRLIDDLLDVSRITQGKIELHKSRVDLAMVVGHALEGIRENCQSKGLTFNVSLPEQPIVIHADAFRFAQVISNLLSNACKFTDRGGEIHITAARENDHAVVRVRDTGAGIPEDFLPRIFDMFAQVETEDGRSGGGLGIGLALAKSIITMHGGTIEARSEGLGRGSEFILRVPALADEAPLPRDADQSSPRSAAPNGPGSRILAVDDNRDALDAVATMLRMNGHAVETADDGEQALEMADAIQPEIVLLDIGLPGIDGYEVARRLRSRSWGGDIQIIAMTGWGQESDKKLASEAGFSAHMTKPVDPDTLERMLSERTRV